MKIVPFCNVLGLSGRRGTRTAKKDAGGEPPASCCHLRSDKSVRPSPFEAERTIFLFQAGGLRAIKDSAIME